MRCWWWIHFFGRLGERSSGTDGRPSRDKPRRNTGQGELLLHALGILVDGLTAQGIQAGEFEQRCGDGTLYAGVTCDLPRRLVQHQQGRGARYTRGRGPLSLAARAAFRPRVCKCRVDAGCKTAAREIANPGIHVPAATTVRSITASPTLLNMAFSRLIPLAVRAHSRHAARSRRFCS